MTILLGQFALPVRAQVVFKTIAPQEPVICGESFRVQFVLEGTGKIHQFSPPSFKGFRVVNGPELYEGLSFSKTSPRPTSNTVYTLQANHAGNYILKGAVALVNGRMWKSNDVHITVISEEDAITKNKVRLDDYPAYLRPGEDPFQKIKDNLFVKVEVDRKTCFQGEAITATFKLYSRLQSRSDIVKNPGFYGFSVFDIINLNDRLVQTIRIKGKAFDVHTIRKVQLFPLSPGIYTIDPMEINNKVEFSRSIVNGKTEQEIIEGVFEENEEVTPGFEEFETNFSTPPVKISVRSFPQKNKPEEFTGATGHFSIVASILENNLGKNQEGHLAVKISGKGNFTQLSFPQIDWPEGMEGFDPVTKDSLDINVAPPGGSRTFIFPFVASRPGNYSIPPVSFTYFDPELKKYSKVSTSAVTMAIADREAAKPFVNKKNFSLTDINRKASFIAGGIVVTLVMITLLYFILGKRKKTSKILKEVKIPAEPSLDEVFQNSYLLLPASDKDFYGNLYKTIWGWLSQRYQLSGSEMNKSYIIFKMEKAGTDRNIINGITRIISLCETGMFTSASPGEDRNQLLSDLMTCLKQIKS